MARGASREMMTWLKTCAWCGNAYQWDPKNKRLHYCTDECRKNAVIARLPKMPPKNAVRKKCELCGSWFQDESHNYRRKYCSSKCSVMAQRAKQKSYTPKTRVCKQCGCEYQHGGKVYCSHKCAGEAKHAKAKQRKCKTCGVIFLPKRAGSRSFCSESCKPKQPELCAYCGGPMPMIYGSTRPMVYCNSVCKTAARQARWKSRSEIKLRARRSKLAGMLQMWRSGKSTEDIALYFKCKEGYVLSALHSIKSYRNRSRKRKTNSTWYDSERLRNARSGQFRLETDFLKHAKQKFSEVFSNVKHEVSIPKSKRKIDLVIDEGLFRFGVELKNGNRTARLDQTLGQAIVKCVALGGLTPVCVVPDDVRPDDVFLNGCASIGAVAGTLTQVIEKLRARCCK